MARIKPSKRYTTLNFKDREKTDRKYSSLRHILDTRVDASIDPKFVDTKLRPSFKDIDEVIEEVERYPIQITRDSVIVIGRNLAYMVRGALATPDDPDPLIPVEMYHFDWDKLSDDKKLEVRAHAMDADLLKDKRRGLNEGDLLFNIQEFVLLGWSKEEIVTKLESPVLKKWRIEALHKKAKGLWTQQQLLKAREKKRELTAAKKPVNAHKLAEEFGLDPKHYAPLIMDEQKRAHSGVAFNGLTIKQKRLEKPWSKYYADSNAEWYRRSVHGTLTEPRDVLSPIPGATKKPNLLPLPKEVYRQITQYHLDRCIELVHFWEGAVSRMNALIERLERESKYKP